MKKTLRLFCFLAVLVMTATGINTACARGGTVPCKEPYGMKAWSP